MAIISRNNSTLHINFPKTIKNNVSDCDAIYIGKTKRTLTKRLNTCNTPKNPNCSTCTSHRRILPHNKQTGSKLILLYVSKITLRDCF